MLKVCLINHKGDATKSCYDLSGYQFALIPEAATRMDIMIMDENIYVKEYYTEFYLLKLAKGITRLDNEDFQSRINSRNFKIKKNTFLGRSYNPKSYIDYEDACELMKSPDNYNVYRSGTLFNDVELVRTEDGIGEGIQSFSRRENLEGVKMVYDIFHKFHRAAIGEMFSQKTDYKIEMSQEELRASVAGPYNSVKIFDIDNPEMDVNLNVKNVQEAIIVQKSDGLTFNTSQIIDGTVVSESKFYPNHLIASIETWINEGVTQDIFPEGFYIRIYRDYKNCVQA
ncbi:uncharacterized protein LOC135922287 [Gordionus sp. m RMFG-2023]|uniref:uncharacterized protein LOC135922287 n=1 Tax=Gordionus sp. m RMFG-2023 TaxID=3053472 RepID=UPI0031FC29FD